MAGLGPALAPIGKLLAGLLEDEAAEIDDQAGAFGQGDEAIGAEEAFGGMAPAGEGFKAFEAQVREAELGLVPELELAGIDGAAELLGGFDAQEAGTLEGRIIDAESGLAGGFLLEAGGVHGDVDLVEGFAGGGVFLGIEPDQAAAGGHGNTLTFPEQGGFHGVEHVLGALGGKVQTGDAVGGDGELVGAEAHEAAFGAGGAAVIGGEAGLDLLEDGGGEVGAEATAPEAQGGKIEAEDGQAGGSGSCV